MAKDDVSNTQVLLVVLLVAILLFVLMGCKIRCAKAPAENFQRNVLAQNQGGRMVHGPVDYAIGEDFRKNPHYLARPSNKFQPLENGPIDFEYDRRKLENGELWEDGKNELPQVFEEFGQWYTGPPNAELHLPNTVPTRNHLARIGDLTAASVLQDEIRPAHRGPGHAQTAAGLRHGRTLNHLEVHLPYQQRVLAHSDIFRQ
uniref:Uncharacterized protein n=1 Tax=Marseillevirus LCMAC103 TaxID=2506604 RepID=A0A481YWL0_9VIRU|nr:MAG: uncharacterized protein LCMAC103_02840 [Marseillevirus LCMAC103]